MFPDIPPGLHFIKSNIASIQDEKQHLPIGFGINFPSLIEYAQNLGINLPIEATIEYNDPKERNRTPKVEFSRDILFFPFA